jgi:RNA polymerase sigma-70 factor (ECF subfamily)
LERYVWAWENADVGALVLLLKEDAAAAMPPLPSWYHGRANIALFLKNHVLTEKLLLSPTRANGQAAFVVSRRMGTTYMPFAVQVMPLRAGLFGSLTLFLNVADFGVFGLPPAVRGSKPKMD